MFGSDTQNLMQSGGSSSLSSCLVSPGTMGITSDDLGLGGDLAMGFSNLQIEQTSKLVKQ